MILVSHDREYITPFNTIWITKYYHKRTEHYFWDICIVDKTREDSVITLGTYALEENAKKVMNDIIKALHYRNDMFYMPIEDVCGNLKYEELYSNDN